MLRTVLCLLVLGFAVLACSAPPVPEAPVTDNNTNSAGTTGNSVAIPAASTANANPTAAVTTVSSLVTATSTPAATIASTTVPTVAATTAPATSAATNTVATSSPATATVTAAPSDTFTPPPTDIITPTGTVTGTSVASTTPVATSTVTITEIISGTGPRVTPALTVTLTITRTPTARPTAKPRATRVPAGPATLTPLLSGQVVTAMYMDPQGNLFYGVARQAASLADAYAGDNSLWKLPAGGGAPIQLTPFAYNRIGGITTHGGYVYFNEAGALRRINDSNNTQDAEAVIIYPMITRSANLPYGHQNHALANYSLNGQDVLLMAFGSVLDSSFPGQGVPANIAPPYYEHFPTGRINWANFSWLDQQHGFVANNGVAGQFEEFARGVRNPWAMTVANFGGQTHIFAIDNDPAFTPEKYDNVPNNAGDELNDIQYHGDYGHPYSYGGGQPVVDFNDGSVPSGVAVAAGKIFVSLHDARMVAKVDPIHHTYTPVLTNIEPFNLLGVGNTLYVADFDGIHVIDASGL